MEVFAEYLAKIDNIEHQERTKEVLSWAAETFPNLEAVIKWNQPMFMHHGTFIIGFSVAQKHLAFSPEGEVVEKFSAEIKRSGYDHSKQLVRIPWDGPVDYTLLKKIIEFNILDKAGYSAFWRK